MDQERERAVRVLEAEFGVLTAQFRRYMRANAEHVSPGLQPGAYTVFTEVVRRGPITLSALAEHLILDKAVVSRAVRELEELELVQRERAPGDGRSSLLTATESGVERLRAARGPAGHGLTRGLADWRLADIQRLAVLLHALGRRGVPGDFETVAAELIGTED